MSIGLPSVALSSQVIQTKRVFIPTASVLLLRATPYTLVDAPGPDRVIEFIDGLLFMDYAGTAYVETDDNLVLEYADGSDCSETVEMTGFIDGTADKLIKVISVKDKILVSNSALKLKNSGNGEFTTGNSPVIAFISYRIWDLQPTYERSV